MNTNLEHSFVQLMDLSDEILVSIFEQLNNIEMFNSLLDINVRLDKILRDPIFTSRFTLFESYFDGILHKFPDFMIDRFCFQILPQIQHNIKWLDLESSSMERIVFTGNYSNLYGLGLYDINPDIVLRLFTDNSNFVRIFKKQITHIVMTARGGHYDNFQKINMSLFTFILTMFTNLTYLNLKQFPRFRIYDPDVPVPVNLSSLTLAELHIYVPRFDDCLCLLDGRFNQLRSLYLKISTVCIGPINSPSTIENKTKLPNLTCFSLTSECDITGDYEELIVPFLHRMVNLERLVLYMSFDREKSFIDGNSLKNDIINQLSRLKKFSFNIYSLVYDDRRIDRPSNEDIQRTFKDFNNYQISSSVDYFQDEEMSLCHIYSHPYKLKYYHHITNNFPGGLFECVETISLFDDRPFEHEFFLRLTQAFPHVKQLRLSNEAPQKYHKSKNDNHHLSIIEFSRLDSLSFSAAHDDYVEQFLNDTKTRLSTGIYLQIDYEILQRVTHNFTNDVTRVNCGKLTSLHTGQYHLYPKLCNIYFPNVKKVLS